MLLQLGSYSYLPPQSTTGFREAAFACRGLGLSALLGCFRGALHLQIQLLRLCGAMQPPVPGAAGSAAAN